MADELSVVVKTKLELDQAQAQAEINKASKIIPSDAINVKVKLDENSKSNLTSSIGKIKVSTPIKIVGKLDTVTTRSNINSAIASLKITKPIKVTLDVDKRASKTRIESAIKEINDSTSKSKINVSPKSSTSNKSNIISGDNGDTESKEIDYTFLGARMSDKIWDDQIKRVNKAVDIINDSSQDIGTEGVQNLLKQLEVLKDKYDDLSASFADPDIDKFGYDTLIVDLKTLDIELRKAFNTANQFNDNFLASQGMEKTSTAIETLKKKFEDLKAGIGDLDSNSSVQAMIAEFEKSLHNVDAVNLKNVQAQFTELTAAIKLARTEAQNTENVLLKNGAKKAEGIGSEQLPKLAQLKQTLDDSAYTSKSTPGFQSLYTEIDRLKTEYASLQAAFSKEDLNADQYAELEQKLKAVDGQLNKLKGTVSQFDGSMKSQQGLEKMDQNIRNLKNSFADMKTNWSKAMDIPELRSQIEEFEAKLQNIDAVNYPQLRAEFQALRSNIRAADADSLSFGNQVKNLFKQLGGFVSITSMFMKARQVFSSMVEDVKQMNTAMTELRKITDLTESGYDKYLADAADRAKEIGTTYVDYVSGTADFARLGYDVPDAQKLSEAANIFYRVGDEIESVGESSDAIISTMKAFGVEAEDVMSIVDKFNQVGNTTSSSSGGLAESMKRSAAALAGAGNSIEESLGLIVGANEVVRDYDTVGTGLKTMALRIRGTETDKEELKEMGEEIDDFVGSASKLQKEIKGLTGVDIMLDEDNFKSSYQILKEISEVWDKLSDVNRANVTEILFGKRQANIGTSILTNFDSVQYAMEQAQNAAGSAMNEHERWAQSIEYSENRAATAFEAFSNKVLSSDVVKGYYDAKAGILGFLTDLIDKTGTAIPLVTSLAAGLLSAKSNFGISKVNMPYPTLDDLGAVA